jgi:octaprenyl-diphosphate synthase
MELLTHTDVRDKTRHSTIPAFRLVDSQLGQVKKLIREQLTAPSKTEGVGRLLDYVSTHSGKMLRPALVLLAGAACGRIGTEHIRVAAVIEMIHNATLLHDDVIDEGKSRRGAATVNSLWGNESAILLGDSLLSRVFKMCATLEPCIARVIAAAAFRVCEGELRQVSQRHNWQLSESEYIDIITEKSAALFSCCCYLGGLLARASESEARSLADFGLNAGIAFQITDDLLDITGDENKTGKTLGSDAGKNKLTLPVIHLLEAIDEREKSEIIEKLNANRYTLNANFIEMLGSYGSLEYTRKRAREFAARAVKALATLEKSDAKDALIEAVKFMADRIA